MAIYLRRSALQSRLKALLSTRNLSFVRGRNCNPDMAPKVPTLKDLTSRIAEKCESLTKNGVEKDDKESNTELGSHSMSVAGANVDDKPVSVQNLSFARDRNCNPDMVPNAPTLKDLTSRIAEKCQALTKNGVEKDNIEPNTELGSHSMNVAGKVDVSKWRKLDSRKLGIQKSKISPSSWAVLKILHGEGFDTYLVGGCVRDLILNKVPKDFDIITTASLQQIKKLFHRCLIIGKRFPICLVSIRGIPIEVSSFETSSKNSKRKEELVPPQVSFGCDKKDLTRWRNSLHRDFTINSLYYDPFVDKVYDYANAMMDLQSLKLRTLVPAQLSFEEDCARILRGLRIAARLGLSFSEETDTAIRKLSSSVTSLAKARLMMEMNYMLSYGAAKPSLCLLRRFNLLEILLPFQAAYLNEHTRKRSSQSSPMLMELFFHLDKLVSCDQPSDCNMWVGLLAFHTALVHKPQDTLVVWTFASVLYHRTWKEAVQFAREHSQVATSFSPEIHEAHDVLSDTELANRVTEFAYFVQYCIGSLVDKDALFQSMCRYPGCQGSDMVFVSPNAGHNTSRLFSMLVDDVEANIQQGRKGFKINYDLLKKGDYDETSFVLGKVITDTLKSGVSQAAKRRRVLPTTANPVQNQFMGEIVNLIANDRTEKQPVLDAKPEEVAQNQQNKNEKVTYDTIVTRVSKWWNKLVRRETVTEEDQKACRSVERGDEKENLNFSEDGILEKQETVIVNEEPEKVNISEKEHQMVKKKRKKKKEPEVKPDNVTEETLEMVDNTLPSPVSEIEEEDKTKNKGGKKKKRDVTENGCQEVMKKRRKVKKESTCTEPEEEVAKYKKKVSQAKPRNVEEEEKQEFTELNNFQDSSLEVVNNTLPGSVLENGQDGVKKKRRKKPKQDDVTEIEEEEAPKVKKKARRRVKSDNLTEERQGNVEVGNFQDSSPEVVNNASPGSDGMVNSSESDEIPKKKEKKLLKETIEYQTQKLRRGRTISEIVAILEKRGKSSSEVLDVIKQKLPNSFEAGDRVKEEEKDVENSKKDDSDKKSSGTALSSLFR